MSAIPQLLAANSRYADRFDHGSLSSPPRRRLAILTCMDSRLVPASFLGLEEGDANVIRNAGGRASDDALRSLIVSCRLLGTQEILVIQHTDCGMMGVDNEKLREQLALDTGADVSDIDFLPIRGDLDNSVRQDVEAIRESPLIPGEVTVRGLVFDVASGRLREVC